MAQGGRTVGITPAEFQLEQQKQAQAALQDTMKNIMSMWQQEKDLKARAREVNLSYQWNMIETLRKEGTVTQSFLELANKYPSILESTFQNMGFSSQASKAYVGLIQEGEPSAEQFERALAAWSKIGPQDPTAAEQGITSTLTKARADARDTGGGGGGDQTRATGGQGSQGGGEPSQPTRTIQLVPAQGTPLPTIRVPVETMEAEKREFSGIAPLVEGLPRVDVGGQPNVDNYPNWKRVGAPSQNVADQNGWQYFSGSQNISPLDMAYGWFERLAKPDGPMGGKAITGSDIPQEVQAFASELVEGLKATTNPETGKETLSMAFALAGAKNAGASDAQLRQIYVGGFGQKFEEGLSTLVLPDPSKGVDAIKDYYHFGAGIMDQLEGERAQGTPSVAGALGKAKGSPMAVTAQKVLDTAGAMLQAGLDLVQGTGKMTPAAASSIREGLHNYDKFSKLLGMTKTEVDRAFDSYERGPMLEYLAGKSPAHLVRLQALIEQEAAATPGGQLENLAKLMGGYAEARTAEARMAEAEATVAGLPTREAEAAASTRNKEIELKATEIRGVIADTELRTMLKRLELQASGEDGTLDDVSKQRIALQSKIIMDLQNDLRGLVTNRDGSPRDIGGWKAPDRASYNATRVGIRRAYEAMGIFTPKEIEEFMSAIPVADEKSDPRFLQPNRTVTTLTPGAALPPADKVGSGEDVLLGKTGYTNPLGIGTPVPRSGAEKTYY